MFIYLLKYRSNIDGRHWPVLWVKHINKDAYSNSPRVFTLQFFLSHGKELPFREADLPNGDVKKASCIKALTAILLKNRLGVTPEPSADFSPLSTKAPCFLKDANSKLREYWLITGGS